MEKKKRNIRNVGDNWGITQVCDFQNEERKSGVSYKICQISIWCKRTRGEKEVHSFCLSRSGKHEPGKNIF